MEIGTALFTEMLREDLAEVVRSEVSKIVQQYQPVAIHKHANFRALNGLPICFYCKRLGHVKKHCRKRQSNIIVNATNEENKEFHQNQTVANDYYAVAKETVTKQKEATSKADDDIKETEEFLVEVGKLFQEMQGIVKELDKTISDACEHNETTAVIGEFETSLFKGAMLEVIATFSHILNALDSTPRPRTIHATVTANNDPFSMDLPIHEFGRTVCDRGDINSFHSDIT